MVLNMFLSFGHLRKSAFALFLNLKVFHLNIALPHLWCFQFSSSHSNVMVLQSPVSEGISIYAQCICLFFALVSSLCSANTRSRYFQQTVSLCVVPLSVLICRKGERQQCENSRRPQGPVALFTSASAAALHYSKLLPNGCPGICQMVFYSRAERSRAEGEIIVYCRCVFF